MPAPPFGRIRAAARIWGRWVVAQGLAAVEEPNRSTGVDDGEAGCLQGMVGNAHTDCLQLLTNLVKLMEEALQPLHFQCPACSITGSVPGEMHDGAGCQDRLQRRRTTVGRGTSTILPFFRLAAVTAATGTTQTRAADRR